MNNNQLPPSGLTPWTTDLFIPEYRPGECGEWRITPGGQLVHDRGYVSGPCLLKMLPLLQRRVRESGDAHRWETWMSLTPHEIESQESGCRCAFGHMGIMGLGMGWVAANAALNPRVRKVTIVELDPSVIELFERSGALASVPDHAACKIEIVAADALEWAPSPDDRVDFLYADIWRDLAEPQALQQVRQMQKNVQAESVYYWGQEFALYCAVGTNMEMTADSLREAAGQIMGLPLLLPTVRDYPEMIRQVIRNRTERALPVDIDLA